MADGPTSCGLTMREPPNCADNTYDHGDELSQENTEGEVDRDPDYAEERFKVDRRKLEHMIQANEDNGESAEGFFVRVMQETNTQISWPSKLKIGAKSKKDPHIKVSGHYESVNKARDRIMAILDTKSTRVTLKMDVSHTEHSHVIGKAGSNIKRVMQDTGCHIHFPDSNRNNQTEKSNQVSIAGQPEGVEEARVKIRELLPLLFMFELPLAGLLQPPPDPSTPNIQHIQNTYGVVVTFKQRPRSYVTMVTIRGSVSEAKAVKEATAVLIEHLTGNIGAAVPVSMQLDIAPQHHLFIIGRSGANIKQIMQRTGASIHFPDPASSTGQRRGTVYITGAIESVYLARQHLIGCLPLVLMFDMKEDIDISQGDINQLMEHLDVFVSIKPKPKQPSKSVIVKSIERNAANLYDARTRLLSNSIEPFCNNNMREGNSSSSSTSYLGLSSNISQMGASHKLLNSSPGVVMMNGLHSPLASPNSFIPSSPGTTCNVYSPVMMLTPGYAVHSMTPSPVTSRPHHTVMSPHTLPSPSAVPQSDLHSPVLAKDIQAPRTSTAHLEHALNSVILSQHMGSTGAMKSDAELHPLTTISQSREIQSHMGGSERTGEGEHTTQNESLQGGCEFHLQQVGRGKLIGDSRAGLNGDSRAGLNGGVKHVRSNGASNKVSRMKAQGSEGLEVGGKSMGGPLGGVSSGGGGDLHFHSSNGLSKEMLDTLQSVLHGSRRPNPASLHPQSKGMSGTSSSTSSSSMQSSTSPQSYSPPVHTYQGLSESVTCSTGLFGLGQQGVSLPTTSALALDTISSLNLNSLLTSSVSSLATTASATIQSPIKRADVSAGGLGLIQSPPTSPHLLYSPPPQSYPSSQMGCRTPPGFSSSRVQNSKSSSPHPEHSLTSTQSFVMDAFHSVPFHNRDLSSSDLENLGEQSGIGSHGDQNHDDSLFSNPNMFDAIDYDQKKRLANKAMQQKPSGETRLPTDLWAGYGFSKSMPDAAIRERLKMSNVRYQGPTMSTTFELGSESFNGDADSDPWKETPAAKTPPSMSPSNSFTTSTMPCMTSLPPAQFNTVGEYRPLTSQGREPESQALSKSGRIILGQGASQQTGSTSLSSESSTSGHTDLQELFKSLGLVKYIELFLQQEIDLSTFMTLTELDLRELGISTFGARRKMVLAIADLQKKQTMPTPVAKRSPSPTAFTEPPRTGGSGVIGGQRRCVASHSGRW